MRQSLSANWRMKISITGSIGSGKTTQAKLVAQVLNLTLIKTGEILRRLVANNTADGRKVKEALDKGEFIEDQIVADAVKQKMEEQGGKNGFIVDGYPRSLDQLKLFDPKFDKVVYLDIPEEEVMARLQKRSRSDDTKEAIKKRMENFQKYTLPIIDYYQSLGILRKVDGLGSEDDIKKRILDSLNG